MAIVVAATVLLLLLSPVKCRKENRKGEGVREGDEEEGETVARSEEFLEQQQQQQQELERTLASCCSGHAALSVSACGCGGRCVRVSESSGGEREMRVMSVQKKRQKLH